MGFVSPQPSGCDPEHWATRDTICLGRPRQWQGPGLYLRRRWGTSQYSVGVQKTRSAGLVLACGTAFERPLVWGYSKRCT